MQACQEGTYHFVEKVKRFAPIYGSMCMTS